MVQINPQSNFPHIKESFSSLVEFVVLREQPLLVISVVACRSFAILRDQNSWRGGEGLHPVNWSNSEYKYCTILR